MRSQTRQFVSYKGPVSSGSVVVFGFDENIVNKLIKVMTGFSSVHCRDGPTIFHVRDGPPSITGPPGGTGPSRFSAESGPPKKVC